MITDELRFENQPTTKQQGDSDMTMTDFEAPQVQSEESNGHRHACDQCDRSFDNGQGLAVHRQRSHNVEGNALMMQRSAETRTARQAALKAAVASDPRLAQHLDPRLMSKVARDGQARRWRVARTKGVSVVEFQQQETDRARALVDRSSVVPVVSGKYDWPKIAAWINQAKADGTYSQDALGRAFGVPKSTAKNWAGTCRDLGLLDDTVELQPSTRSSAVVAKSAPIKVSEHDDADRLFAAVGKATDSLFPSGVPGDRVIEVAEWQMATMRMMRR